jgi:mRNA-degrading endonuclease RelE of RelBE toxin-antitoxin system
MNFIETPIFTRRVNEILTDEEYRQLQIVLIARPEVGDVIQGSGGLRKMRWAAKGHGKRGGSRVIYYWAISEYEILLLYIYPKNVQDDLSPAQLRALRQVVEEKYHG